MATDNEGRRRDAAVNRYIREAEAESARALEQRRRDREPGARGRRLAAALAEMGKRRTERGR